MKQSDAPVLKGFDSYELRLGDELRGHRATLSKSLLDAQRDLRIKAAYVDAIENCDASVIPNQSFVAGYVRSYARYLGLDPDEIFERFCQESGFRPESDNFMGPAKKRRGRVMVSRPAKDPALSKSHFAAPLGKPRSVGIGVSLSALMSVAVLMGLIGGLGYGGWVLLNDIQRVGFAPSPETPEAATTPVNVADPGRNIVAAGPVDLGLGAEQRTARLEELYAPPDLDAPAVALRDGPIAAINPDRAGVFAPEAGGAAAAEAAPTDPIMQALEDQWDGGLLADYTPLPGEIEEGVGVIAATPAWIRIRLADGGKLVERVFAAGETFNLPQDVTVASLRAGNAGDVYISVDGVLYGPVGAPNKVAKNVSLAAEDVRAAFPVARNVATPDAQVASGPGQRAEVFLSSE